MGGLSQCLAHGKTSKEAEAEAPPGILTTLPPRPGSQQHPSSTARASGIRKQDLTVKISMYEKFWAVGLLNLLLK